ncbi:MAG: hypothetical protein L3J54_07000, partial [Draconibacterium sp.]|nr:hypothetical protein [Draconibacterium sp.]
MSDFKIQDIKLQDTSISNPTSRPTKADAVALMTPERQFPASSEQVRDINALKQDLSRMSTSLRESMRLNQDSVGEIEKFSRFLKIAEVNTISLERLQPENLELKAKLEDVRNELSKKQLWASELESKSL